MNALSKTRTSTSNRSRGEDSKAITLDVDPTEYGYKQLDEKFQNGLYEGQAADPRKIGAALRKLGVKRYLFKITDKGQFDVTFVVFIHEDEYELAAKFDPNDGDGADPAIMLKRGLETAAKFSHTQDRGDKIVYSTIDLGTGEARTRLVSQEEFIRGVGKEEV